MVEYAALALPSANRVYAASAPELMAAELRVVGGGAIGEIAAELIGGRPYLVFGGPALDGRNDHALARLSALYALFERRGDLLRPIELDPGQALDDDIVTIQRYVGKTNELFTRLLINVTIASSLAPRRPDRRAVIMDPLCGRGTTLNCSLLYGYDAAGVEIEPREFDAYCTFLLAYLQRKRIKHTVQTRPGRAARGKVRRLLVRFSADADAYAAGDTQAVNVVNADTLETAALFRAGTVDAIVTDAPYGVQHGSRRGQQGRSRSPLELIQRALDGWLEVLRDGAPVGIAFNTLVLSRAALADALAAAGLEILSGPGYDDFVHRVDQGIVRDLVIARRPR
jgi:hypothetical protein